MSISLVYWILMFMWLLVGGRKCFATKSDWLTIGGDAFVFILFVMLGWHAFGPPIK